MKNRLVFSIIFFVVATLPLRHAIATAATNPLATVPGWSKIGDQADAFFGVVIASAGDVNGDGYDDVIVGAPKYDNGQTDEGKVWVYLGSSTGLPSVASWTAESDQANASFGTVAPAGDINGDGYDDVIVGAPKYDNDQANEGRVFVYLGSSTGLPSVASWTAESDQAETSFGFSVSTAGDVNGDGYDDVIIGAYGYDNGQTDEGRAYVYLGSSTGLSTSAAWSAESDLAGAHYGRSVSTAGDVNGDGYDDVIVGAYAYDNGQTDEGKAWVYLGSSTGLSASAVWSAESDQANASFGVSVSTAGDVNGDGYDDVVVGAYGYDNGQIDEGRAFVYLGSSSGLSTSAAWTAESDLAGAQYGFSVSTAGDVNGDNYSDVIVGARNFKSSDLEPYEGKAYVYLGSSTGLSTSISWSAESDSAMAEFGTSVSTAGDVDGNGASDVIVGAPWYQSGPFGPSNGRVYVYQGTPVDRPDFIGVFRNGWWYLDANGSMDWNEGDTSMLFGFATDVPVPGDWDGNGTTDMGVFRNRWWYLDSNGTPGWNEGDAVVKFGLSTDVPVSGDWNGDGKQDMGVFRKGWWYLDSNGTPGWNVGDAVVRFGLSTDVPVSGDWNGDGKTDVGVFRKGWWYLDSNGTPGWNEGDTVVRFGLSTDVPISGDWNDNGITDIGVMRGRWWYLDSNGNLAWDNGVDAVVRFGYATDKPVTGSW